VRFLENMHRRHTMAKVRPIKPNDIVKAKKENIPEVVFESFNELIAKGFNGSWSTVRQKDVVALLVSKGVSRGEIFDNHWLDIEVIYREAGWAVTYDSPAYCESYEPYFEFSLK